VLPNQVQNAEKKKKIRLMKKKRKKRRERGLTLSIGQCDNNSNEIERKEMRPSVHHRVCVT